VATATRKGTTMVTNQLPTSMGEIARVALAAIDSLPGCVGVTVLTSTGQEVPMSRDAALYWSDKL